MQTPAAPGLPQVTRDSAYLLSARVVAFLATLAVALMFSRLSTPSVYGQYQYVVTWLGVMFLFALPGMVVAITRASARGADRTLWPGTVQRVKFSGAGALGLLVLAGVFAWRGEASLARAAVIAGLLFPTFAALDTYFSHLAGRREFQRYAVLQIIQTVAPLPFMLAALAAGWGLEAVVMAYLGITGGVNALLLRDELRRLAPEADVDTEGLAYGRRVSGVYVIGAVQMHAAALVVGTYLGPVSLAVFSIGLIGAEAFRQAIGLFNMQIFPSLAALDDAASRRLLRRSVTLGLPIVAGAALLTIVLLPVLVPLLFTTQYRDSILYAQIMVASVVLGFPGNQANNYLAARARVPAQYVLAASMLAAEIIGLVVLTRPLGLLGVVVAKALTRVWYSAYAWRLMARRDDA